MPSHLIATATDDVVSTWELTREEAQLQHQQIIYESRTPTVQSTMSSGYGTVNCLGWNHTQQVLACGTDDGAVALMLDSGKMLEVLQEPCEARNPPTPIISLAWGKRSRHLVTTGQGDCPSLWDLKKKERIMSFQGHGATITSVALAPEDACVASGDKNGEILLHALHSENPGMSLPLDVKGDPVPRTPSGLMAAGVRSLHFWTARQPLLLAGHRDGVARVWDSTAGACLMTFKGQHYMSIVAVAGSPASDKLMVTAGQDRKALLWDVTNRKLLKEVKALAPITSMCFNPEGDMIILGLKNGNCSIYDIRNQHEPLRTTHAFQGLPIRALSVQAQHPRSSGHTTYGSSTSMNGRSTSRSSGSSTTTKNTEPASSPTAPKIPLSISSAQKQTSTRTTSNTTTITSGGSSGSSSTAAVAPLCAKASSPVAVSFSSITSLPSTSISSPAAASAIARQGHTVQPAPSPVREIPPSFPPSSLNTDENSSNSSSDSSSISALPSSRTNNVSLAFSSIPPSKVSTNPATVVATQRPPISQEEVQPSVPVEQQQEKIQTQPQSPAGSENSAFNANSSNTATTSNAFRWRGKLNFSSSISATAFGPQNHSSAAAAIASAAARSTNSDINTKEFAQLVESKVKDMVDDLRDELARDLRGLHLELLKTSETTHAAMQGLVQTFQALMEENRGLRREMEELQQQMEMPY
ncbi:hypothetical protein VYU27_000344 [Nannochloropsis oceanica]